MLKVDVIADGSGQWASNNKTYDTHEEATAAAIDLASRWMLVTDWRVSRVPSDECDRIGEMFANKETQR